MIIFISYSFLENETRVLERLGCLGWHLLLTSTQYLTNSSCVTDPSPCEKINKNRSQCLFLYHICFCTYEPDMFIIEMSCLQIICFFPPQTSVLCGKTNHRMLKSTKSRVFMFTKNVNICMHVMYMKYNFA